MARLVLFPRRFTQICDLRPLFVRPLTQALNIAKANVDEGNFEEGETLSEAPSSPEDRTLNKPSEFTIEARVFLTNSVGPKLGIVPGDLDGWYNVSIAQLLRHGAHWILPKFRYSLLSLYSSVLPENIWYLERFKEDPKSNISIWKDRNNVRAFLEYVGETIGIKDGDYPSWYKVSLQDILNLGGQSLLESKQFKIPLIVKTAFPEHMWDENAFVFKPTNYKVATLRKFFLKIGEKIGIKEGDYAAWYNVSREAINRNGGRVFLIEFNESRFRLFSTVFPEHQWHPWLFKKLRRNVDKADPDVIRKFAPYLEEKLHITRPEDWYAVTKPDLEQLNLPYLFETQASLVRFLRRAYPKNDWNPEKMAWSNLGWSHFRSVLEQLFPGEVVTAANSFSKASLKSLSFYARALVIPKLKLMFEYQGPITYADQILEDRQFLTRVESESLSNLCKTESFTLITVPFWWDRDMKSILGAIWEERKDIFEKNGFLENLRNLASTAEPTPFSAPLQEMRINKGYIRRWSQDPRFEAHLSREGAIADETAS